MHKVPLAAHTCHFNTAPNLTPYTDSGLLKLNKYSQRTYLDRQIFPRRVGQKMVVPNVALREQLVQLSDQIASCLPFIWGNKHVGRGADLIHLLWNKSLNLPDPHLICWFIQCDLRRQRTHAVDKKSPEDFHPTRSFLFFFFLIITQKLWTVDWSRRADASGLINVGQHTLLDTPFLMGVDMYIFFICFIKYGFNVDIIKRLVILYMYVLPGIHLFYDITLNHCAVFRN